MQQIYHLSFLFFIVSCSSELITEEASKKEKWHRKGYDSVFVQKHKVLIDTLVTKAILPDDISWIRNPMIDSKHFHHYRTVSYIFEDGVEISHLDSSFVDNHHIFGIEENTVEWQYSNRNLYRRVIKNNDTISFQSYYLDSTYFDTTKTIISLVTLKKSEEEINIYGYNGKNLTKTQLKYIDSLKGRCDDIQVEYFDYILSKHCKDYRVGNWKHYTVNHDSVKVTKWVKGVMVKNETEKT